MGGMMGMPGMGGGMATPDPAALEQLARSGGLPGGAPGLPGGLPGLSGLGGPRLPGLGGAAGLPGLPIKK
jgi:signal recognition particle subunit SRP54